MTGISSRGRRSGRPGDSKLRELLSGLTILKREPKVLVGGLVRIINTTSQFAFVVFMPLYLKDYGIGDTQWASIWGSVFLFNILFNLVFGIVGVISAGDERSPGSAAWGAPWVCCFSFMRR